MKIDIINNLIPRLEEHVRETEKFVEFITGSVSVKMYRVFDMNNEGAVVNPNNSYIYSINELGEVKCIEQDKLVDNNTLENIKSITRNELFDLVESIKHKIFWSENLNNMSKNEILIYCMAKYFSESVSLGEVNGHNYYLEYDEKRDLYYVVVKSTEVTKMMDVEYCPVLISKRVKRLADSKVKE